jgi:hypothetical protein
MATTEAKIISKVLGSKSKAKEESTLGMVAVSDAEQNLPSDSANQRKKDLSSIIKKRSEY